MENYLSNLLVVEPITKAIGYEVNSFKTALGWHRIYRWVGLGFSLSESDKAILKNMNTKVISFNECNLYSKNDLNSIREEFKYIHNLTV